MSQLTQHPCRPDDPADCEALIQLALRTYSTFDVTTCNTRTIDKTASPAIWRLFDWNKVADRFDHANDVGPNGPC